MSDEMALAYLQYFVYFLDDQGKTDTQFLDALSVASSALRENESSWSWYEIDWAGWDDEEDCGIIPEGWWEHTAFHPDCEFDCPVDEPVTHWIPLPNPPEGGASNG